MCLKDVYLPLNCKIFFEHFWVNYCCRCVLTNGFLKSVNSSLMVNRLLDKLISIIDYLLLTWLIVPALTRTRVLCWPVCSPFLVTFDPFFRLGSSGFPSALKQEVSKFPLPPLVVSISCLSVVIVDLNEQIVISSSLISITSRWKHQFLMFILPCWRFLPGAYRTRAAPLFLEDRSQALIKKHRTRITFATRQWSKSFQRTLDDWQPLRPCCALWADVSDIGRAWLLLPQGLDKATQIKRLSWKVVPTPNAEQIYRVNASFRDEYLELI